MSCTPVLTKLQQKNSLSGRKTPGKSLKNVLTQPHENHWPLLKHDEGAKLENLLKKCLPIYKKQHSKVPWSQLRKMTREERLAARKNLKSNKNLETSVVFGVNAVVRCLEKEQIGCVLLDGNVDPPLLIKHVVILAQNQEIPTLVIHFLKKVTLDSLGFSCLAIGLKKSINSSEENLNELQDKVEALYKELPVKKSSKILFTDVAVPDTVKNNCEEVKKVSSDIYLYRSSKKERVFQPPLPDPEAKWDDFISLGDDEEVFNKPKTFRRFFEVEDHYAPLMVKRIQGNAFRSKATKVPKAKKTSKS